MTEDRTNIIIKEIQYWKENKLLPSQYCDFLLALYTQGDTANLTDGSDDDSNEITKLKVVLITSNLFLIPITFLGLYLMNSGFIQVIFSIFMLCTAVSYYIGSKKSHNMNVTFAFIIMLCVLLGVSVYYINYIFGILIVTSLAAGIQFIIWIFLGIRFKTILLILFGSIGLVSAIFYYVF